MQRDLQQHYLPLGTVSCYVHTHIHSHIFIKCYLIHLEKACFLGFVWEFNRRLKLLQLGNAERTFRKYFIVLCKPHGPERLSKSSPCLPRPPGGAGAGPISHPPLSPSCQTVQAGDMNTVLPKTSQKVLSRSPRVLYRPPCRPPVVPRG